MKTKMTTAAALALILGTLALPGRAEDDASSAKDDAVMCPKCEVVWVREARTVGKLKVFVSKKKMTCDDCKSAVENYFATGKLSHACKTCGDLVACESVQGEEPADAEKATHRRD